MKFPVTQFGQCIIATAILLLCLLSFVGQSTAQDFDLPIEAHKIPFDFSSPAQSATYTPSKASGKGFSVCVLVPHMKDEYWISVHSGFQEKAKQLQLNFDWHEAGGYLNLDRQVEQIRTCVSKGHDAIVIGAVSAKAPKLLKAVSKASQQVPVIALVNDLASPDLTAKIAVSWERMGQMLGEKIVSDLPKGPDRQFTVRMVSGPSSSGWAPILERGLREGLKSDRITVIKNFEADSDYHNQFQQVEAAVAECGPNDILVGSAPAAEAAMSLINLIPCASKPKIYATYYSHAVKRGLRSSKIAASVVDFPVLQGWLAADQATKLLTGSLKNKQVGPTIQITTPKTLPADRWAIVSEAFR
ncbi:TMAO reductase system periplasmic protein TorT [Pseudovibrio sp. Alg231-02]|uniref:TMAO reductase system periplasmic protein TorT n=1 Tax=Pseudovibrio sp. Alg231-02 TaxID=1922223 RepID=UPI000D55BCC9|nr:TMAO reductase system periplasmic protein TorT [Pseudovibrio sp. Alg231-02]